ncbi:MAG TPA: aldehyde dehydrogenase family protein, partial [Pyrinomonadaceae bacterium]|nr:aldehyde dehydrogenase family protein [Pyrinomonadaceae bacterium]
MHKIENYIGGELSAPASNEYLDNFNPALGEVYSLIPDSNENDIKSAVEAAKKAFPDWSKMSAEHRHDCLMRLSSLLERDLDALAEAESADNGKPKTLARSVDIPRAVSNFKFYAT